MAFLHNPKNSKSLLLLAHIGCLAVVCCWATSFLASKVLMEDGGMTPVEVFVYRFSLAYIVLLCFTWRKIASNSWRHELIFAICGICAGSLYFIAENYALKLTSTGNVSLLASISPLFTTILMAIVYRSRIAPPVVVGSVVSFIGVGCVIFSNGTGLEFHPEGDLLALSAAMSWAVYTILIKRITPYYNSFFVTRKLFFYGVLTALPLMLSQHEPLHLMELFDVHSPKLLLNLLFLALLCSLGAYLVWNETMKILGPVTANNYLYVQPVITLVAAYFIMAEPVYPLGYLGCVLVIGGLVLADKWKGVGALRLKRHGGA